MKLDEALEIQNFEYTGTRDYYQIHDNNPNVLIIDKSYNVDAHGESVLGFNLNYLDNMNPKEKKKLVAKINKIDNKVLNVGAVKSWLRSLFGYGDYNLSKDKKIERYKTIINKVPELKKIIRRYKYDGIKGDIKK